MSLTKISESPLQNTLKIFIDDQELKKLCVRKTKKKLTSNMYGNASTLYETFRHTLNLLLRASGTHLTGLGNLTASEAHRHGYKHQAGRTPASRHA